MQTKDFSQTVILPCSPQTAYEAWLDSQTHGKMIHAPAKIDPKVGGTFSIWDDYLVGKTLRLDPKKHMIVQSWRDTSTDWEENYFSTITLIFTPFKDNQTQLEFTHIGVPVNHATSIKDGWTEFYWEPMQAYFKNQ